MDDFKLFSCVVWVCLLCLCLVNGFKYKYPIWFKRKDEAIYVSSSKNNLTMETYKTIFKKNAPKWEFLGFYEGVSIPPPSYNLC